GFLVSRTTYHTKNETFLKYVDPTGASVVKIADVNPDFNLSLTTNLRFKGFTAYALLDWVQGGKIYNGTRQWPFFELRDRVYDQSSKARVNCAGNPDPTCPYSTGKKSGSYYQALYNGINPIDFFVENGTYVKIKEINVSYSIGRSFLEKIGIGGISGIKLATSTACTRNMPGTRVGRWRRSPSVRASKGATRKSSSASPGTRSFSTCVM